MNLKVKGTVMVFSLVLLSELYLPIYKLNLGLQFIFAAYLIFTSNKSFSISFIKIILPLIGLFFLGFAGYLLNFYELVNVFKDVSYFIKPIFGIIIGYEVFKNQGNIAFAKTVIALGFLTAILHIANIALFSNFSRDSISSLRSDFGLDNFLEVYAFFLLIYYKRFTGKQLTKNKYLLYFIACCLLSSILIYFSRAMLGCLIILALTFSGFTKLTKKSLKVVGVCILCIGIFYGYLFSIKLDRGSRGVEALLYKIKNAPQEVFETKISRENHVKLWDHWRGYEAKRAFDLMNENLYSYIVGTGFGSQVNLKFEAPLGDEGEGMKYISRLHNGYVFVFYKTGMIGLIFYLTFLIKLYKRIYIKVSDIFLARFISAIGLFYLFTSLIISGVYISSDTIILLLGGAIACEGFLLRKQHNQMLNNC